MVLTPQLFSAFVRTHCTKHCLTYNEHSVGELSFAHTAQCAIMHSRPLAGVKKKKHADDMLVVVFKMWLFLAACFHYRLRENQLVVTLVLLHTFTPLNPPSPPSSQWPLTSNICGWRGKIMAIFTVVACFVFVWKIKHSSTPNDNNNNITILNLIII